MWHTLRIWNSVSSLVQSMAYHRFRPNLYLDQSWHIVANMSCRSARPDIRSWGTTWVQFKSKCNICHTQNAFENVACKMSAILPIPQYIEKKYSRDTEAATYLKMPDSWAMRLDVVLPPFCAPRHETPRHPIVGKLCFQRTLPPTIVLSFWAEIRINIIIHYDILTRIPLKWPLVRRDHWPALDSLHKQTVDLLFLGNKYGMSSGSHVAKTRKIGYLWI